MAGDWIKMRVDLAGDPAVIGIAARLDIEEDLVVGKLHRLWSWADRQTVDGKVPGVSHAWIDRHVGKPGFAEAMASVGWLHIGVDGLEFPNFDRHSGETAKRRAENTSRARLSRNCRADVAQRSHIPRTITAQVLRRDADTCVYCGLRRGVRDPATGPIQFSVDHLIPDSRGGPTSAENLVTSCLPCNMVKSDRTPEEAGMALAHLQSGLSYSSGKIVVVAHPSRKSRDKSATREEKRREEKRATTTKDPPLSVSPEEELLRYPCAGAEKGEWVLTCAQAAEWGELYPGVDVVLECRAALGWVKANPERRKTRRGMPAFLANWLKRAQDRGGSNRRDSRYSDRTQRTLDALESWQPPSGGDDAETA